MTGTSHAGDDASFNIAPSLLPIRPEDLTSIRVRPADFARAVGVSKQCVSGWIKRGIVTLGADGRMNPSEAGRQVIARADPARLRAKVFKVAAADLGKLRTRCRDLEDRLADADAAHAAALQIQEFRFGDRQAERLFDLQSEMVARFDALVDARAQGDLEGMIERMADRHFYPEIEPPSRIGRLLDEAHDPAGEAAAADADETSPATDTPPENPHEEQDRDTNTPRATY